MAIHISIPKKWDELSPIQAKNISYILYCFQCSIQKLPEQEFLLASAAYIQVIKELLRHNKIRASKKALKLIAPKTFKSFVEFIFKENKLHHFPEYFKVKRQKLYGPSLRLRNLTVEEFSFADAVYFRFKVTNDIKYLDLLCSTLYRKRKKTNRTPGDNRIPYSRLLAEANVDYFKKLSKKEKIVVAFAYEGSRNHLVSQFPNVFPKTKIKKRQDSKNPSPKAKYTPIGKLVSSKINYDPSKLKQANHMNIYSFFAVYENELVEIKLLKRKNRRKK